MRQLSICLVAAAIALTAAACKNDNANKVGGGSSIAQTTTTDNSAQEQTLIDNTREFLHRAFDLGDTAYTREHATADMVDHNPAPNQKPGVEGLVDFIREWRTAFPDAKIVVNDIVAKGEKVWIYNTLSGTNTGTFMGKPASGKKISVEGVDIVRIVDGKMVEHWGWFDQMKFMEQMGMMPDMNAAAAPAAGDTAKKAG
jgi:steroid delta-isomerase-like uncharacterized protein